MKRLAELRAKTGMNQKEFALLLGFPYTTYRQWEIGRNEPDIATLILLADCFNVSVDYLIGRTDTPNVEVTDEEAEPDKLMEQIYKLSTLPNGEAYIDAIIDKIEQLIKEEEEHKRKINEILKK